MRNLNSVMNIKQMFTRLVFLLLGILLVYNFVLVKKQSVLINAVPCHFKPNVDDGFPSLDSTAENAISSSERNIFFIETRCSDSAELNCRQACAVESAAFMNPNMNVNLLFLNPAAPSNSTLRLVERLLTYDNIKIHRINAQEYIKNTPLEHWFSKEVVSGSNWPIAHTSDILRLLTLWKYGGIYLDLDTVDTTNLEDLKNFAGAEDGTTLANGVLGLSKTGTGHKIADMFLAELTRDFNGKLWSHNGPGVITRVMQSVCGVSKAEDMTAERCLGFRVFPSDAFYPIGYPSWKKYFTATDFNETMNRIKRARLIHVWNLLSSSTPVQIGSKVPYDVVAEKHCSRVYHSCGSQF